MNARVGLCARVCVNVCGRVGDGSPRNMWPPCEGKVAETGASVNQRVMQINKQKCTNVLYAKMGVKTKIRQPVPHVAIHIEIN